MQPYSEAPPPYSSATEESASSAVAAKGDYQGVPVYEIQSNQAPIYEPTTYQQTPLISSNPGVIVQSRFGRNPVHCVCPQCHQQIVTHIAHDSGVFAWLMCLLLTVIGCIPCCLIPFCVSSCQDATHTCPHCSTVLARHRVL